MIFGPPSKNLPKAYGGGVGGYTKNMEMYLERFNFSDIEVKPLYHTIRGEFNFYFFTFFVRFIIDAFRIVKQLHMYRPNGIHIMGIYGSAVPRELFLIFFCKIARVNVLYQIRAGTFVSEYKKRGFLYRRIVDLIVKNSSIVLVEGKAYKKFIYDHYGINAIHFPNVVQDSEIPKVPQNKLDEGCLKILFVGSCHREKGVFELLDGCIRIQNQVKIQLTLIGKEEKPFESYLNDQLKKIQFKIDRRGRQPREVTLEAFSTHDIYCYPTYHEGEGHNNTINEAMMMGMVIVASKNGFLPEVLSNETAYFLDEISAIEIAGKLMEIHSDRARAREKAAAAYNLLKEKYTVSIASKKIHGVYKSLVA